MEHVTALFTQSREVGANDGKVLGSCNRAKTAGSFLLEFRLPDIAFRLIVVEGHAQIGEKAQHVGRVLSQADEQIERGRLFDEFTQMVGITQRVGAVVVQSRFYSCRTDRTESSPGPLSDDQNRIDCSANSVT